MITTVYKATCATVTYDPEKKLQLLVWHGNPTSDEYRKPFLAMIEFAKKSKTESIITDVTHQGVISPEDRKWFEKEMTGKGIEEGLKRIAVVTTANVFKRYYLNLLIAASNKLPLAIKLFSSQQDATKWISGFKIEKPELAEMA